MKFCERTHKVKIESLSSFQAEEFDKFLVKEIARHGICITDAWKRAANSCIAEIWESAQIRHTKDLEDIHKLRIKLRELFEL